MTSAPDRPSRSLEAVQAGTDMLSVLAGWGLVLLSVLIGVEVVARKLLGFSIQGADEIGGYTLAAVSSIGFIVALVNRAHVRIDLAVKRLPLGAQAWLNILALGTFGLMAGIFAWRALAVVQESLAMGAHAPTPLQTPLVLPQALWAAAYVTLALVAALGTIQAARRAVSGDAAGAADTWGIETAEEAAETELQAMAADNANVIRNG
ncbi:TRAP transporter small permease subunit [Pseudooceanicola lipolyticus]|nr:TRAP transporter small permease [Pseudooceanicola lipolyticus]